MSFAAYIAFYSSEVQKLNDEGLVCRRPKGNCYTCCDERWVLEFYWEHRNDSVEELATSVMKNEQMWGRDLTEIPGFLAATIENLQKIRNQGALSAYRECI
jgi:tagaturonate reductase